MKALLQRVCEADVRINGEVVGAIQHGLLVLLGVERGDSDVQVERMAARLLGYRVFADTNGRMNRSVRDVGGSLLLVSQFTLVADTAKGTRPGFSRAAEPALAEQLYRALAQRLAPEVQVATGRFGADMQVSLINDGPVTFLLEV